MILIENIYKAKVGLRNIVHHTPLLHNPHFSDMYEARIAFKREDLQVVRSYKIRGAYHKIASLTDAQRQKGVVCASAGNHAQGVALACRLLDVKGVVYMPRTTPQQKIKKVRFFGKENVQTILSGDSFDDAYQLAVEDAAKNKKSFIHPFDDPKIMEGQGTVGVEIMEDSPTPIDYVFVAIGGGGLASGLGSFFKQMSPQTKIIGVEPSGAPAMYRSLEAGKIITLSEIDSFVDGAAVRQVGQHTFRICKKVIDDMALIPEGKVCSTILQLYNEEGIVVEPAGALTIAALDAYRTQIKGKNVVCVISGGNNDITRTEEIKERSLLYEKLKHYFIIRFPQRAGALREFLNVLGENDDIAYFEYTKKHNRASGPALVGIELQAPQDYQQLIHRMKAQNIDFQHLNSSPLLFEMLI